VRIAYVCYLVGWRPDGVSDKIQSQLRAWVSAGHEPTLFLLARSSPGEKRREIEAQSFVFSSAIERPLATSRLYAAVRRHRPDVIYLRYDLFLPPPSVLSRIAPVVVEFNSNAQVEWANRSRGAAMYERLQERLLLRRAAGAVCVAHELAASVRRKRPDLPVRVIANGIPLAGVPELPAPRGEGIRLAYLGDDVYWQGVDKLFALADALPDWHIDIIGVSPERSDGNVTCHGYLGAEQFEPILARADVAVGPLALHRKRMDGTSAIKVQRYLAYGLPVILGYEETDFVGTDPWYLLRLPNTESNVRDNLERIRAFVTGVKGRRVSRAEVAEKLSADSKEAGRLVFLADLVGDQLEVRGAT
jgi:hypothetical protein